MRKAILAFGRFFFVHFREKIGCTLILGGDSHPAWKTTAVTPDPGHNFFQEIFALVNRNPCAKAVVELCGRFPEVTHIFF